MCHLGCIKWLRLTSVNPVYFNISIWALFACLQSVQCLTQYHEGLTSSGSKLKLSLRPGLMISSDLLRAYFNKMTAQQCAVWHKLFLVSGAFTTQRTQAYSLDVRPPQSPITTPQQHHLLPSQTDLWRGGPFFSDTVDERTNKHQQLLQLLREHTNTQTLHLFKASDFPYSTPLIVKFH